MTGRRSKTRFLDASEIDRGIAEIAELSSAQKVRVALIGGAALQLFGSERLTKDVDIVSIVELDGLRKLGELSFGGIQASTEGGVPVDLVMRDDEYDELYAEALATASNVPGVPIPVASAEHMLAMKLVAGRAKDLADMEFLVLDSGLDYPKARDIVKRHLGPYAARELDKYKESIEWERSRGQR